MIADRVMIMDNARIEAIEEYGCHRFSPILHIQEGVTIQQNLHLTCAEKIIIGKNTALVANVTITDIVHPYTAKDEK